MHRHAYQGKKLSRKTGQRHALLKSLATSLILKESITTTKPKAKALIPYFERLVTKARKGTLHDRRLIARQLTEPSALTKLCDELAPRWKERVSGHVRIKPAGYRKGDSAQLSTVSLILDAKIAKTAAPTEKAVKKPAKPAARAKQPAKAATRKEGSK